MVEAIVEGGGSSLLQHLEKHERSNLRGSGFKDWRIMERGTRPGGYSLPDGSTPDTGHGAPFSKSIRLLIRRDIRHDVVQLIDAVSRDVADEILDEVEMLPSVFTPTHADHLVLARQDVALRISDGDTTIA